MTTEYLNKVRDFFKGKPVLKAYLFGSFSREEADDNSDVDILVELDYSVPVGLEFVKMQLELQELLERKVDLLTVKSLSKYLTPIIDEEKILIYER